MKYEVLILFTIDFFIFFFLSQHLLSSQAGFKSVIFWLNSCQILNLNKALRSWKQEDGEFEASLSYEQESVSKMC